MKKIIGVIFIICFILNMNFVFASRDSFDVGTGVVGSSDGAADSSSWGYSKNFAGTRYIIEIDNNEVGR